MNQCRVGARSLPVPGARRLVEPLATPPIHSAGSGAYTVEVLCATTPEETFWRLLVAFHTQPDPGATFVWRDRDWVIQGKAVGAFIAAPTQQPGRAPTQAPITQSRMGFEEFYVGLEARPSGGGAPVPTES